MTISTESTRVEFTGDGATLPFAVPFKFLDKTDLVVVLRTILTGVDAVQTIYTHYTVLGAGDANGTVTFVTAPPSTQKVVIYNDPPLTQLVDYLAGDTFPAETHETALDRLTIQQKRTREITTRAILLPDADTDGSGAYDAKSNRIKNLSPPTATTDAATKVYVDSTVSTTIGPIPTSDAYVTATGSITSRKLADRFADEVNVKDFGATGDGVTDDLAAINAAFSAVASLGGGEVFFPPGTYKINGQLTPGTNVSIRGSGIDTTLIDGSAATYTAVFGSAGMLVYPATAYTALPALASNVSVNDRTLTFASAPSVVAGDIIQIYNDTDYSWSGHRDYYRAGESVRVATVAGNVVTLQGTLSAPYVIADVDVYKLANPNTVKLSDFSFKGLADAANVVKGISLSAGVDCMVENVRAYNSSYIQMYLDACFNVTVNGCICEEDFSSDHGGDYGLGIGGSTNVTVLGGYFSAARHGMAIGNATLYSVPGRYHKIVGAHISTSSAGGVQAADIHGDAEWITYDGCTIDGGIDFGGDHIVIQNCLIRAEPVSGGVSGCSIVGAEFKGCHMTIQNNMVQHSDTVSSRGAFVEIGGNGAPIAAGTKNGGTILIDGNNFQWNPPAGAADNAWLAISNRGYAGTENIGVVITNNTVMVTNNQGDYGKTTGQIQGFASVRHYSGNIWDSITYNNNTTYGASGLYTLSAGNSVAKRVDCKNNSTSWGGFYGYSVVEVRDSIVFTGNTSERCAYGGVALGGSAAVKCTDVVCSGNSLTHNFVQAPGSSTVNADIVPSNITRLSMDNNFTGSDALTLTVANNTGFLLGEVITGGTSGATGTVTGTRSTDSIYISETIQSGPFNFGATETITGADSGATTTVSNQYNSQYFSTSGISVDEAWRSNNIDYNGRWQYIAGITTDHGGTVTLGSGDATPSVNGGKTFITAGSTAITDFDDGVDGQLITVRAHGAITLTDSATLQLQGDADFVMAADDTVTLANIGGTNWYETGRRQVSATYAASNVSADRAYDADSTTTAELADVLGTLIADLRLQGIVK